MARIKKDKPEEPKVIVTRSFLNKFKIEDFLEQQVLLLLSKR
jgi:hypothetical protein